MQLRGTTTILAGAIAAAVTFFQPAPAKAADIGIQFIIDQTTGTLTSSLAGVGISDNGTNSWLIDLSSVLARTFGGGTNMTWVDNDTGVNWLRRINGTQFQLDTDWTAPTTASRFCGQTFSPLPQGISCLVGAGSGNAYFATVVERDSVPVPEPMALALFGLAVAGLGVARRRATG